MKVGNERSALDGLQKAGLLSQVNHGQYEKAIKRRSGRIVTLRQKTRVLADSRRRD
jgi:hypothetical protein